MISLFNKYKSAVRNMYGWSVELTCAHCNFSGLPRYEGWSPGLTAESDSGPTIHAKLACPKCGNRLTGEAGRKLASLFKDVAIPEQNDKIIKSFIGGLITFPVALAGLYFMGMQMDWWRWGFGTVLLLAASAAYIPALVIVRNWRIAGLRTRCECGDPTYVFHGLLERTSCYRCASCGRLLRLRD